MKTIDFDFNNVGGMSRLYLIDIAGLVRCDVNVKNRHVRPVLTSENMMYNIGVLSGDDFVFTENLLQEDGGEVFDVAISGFLPKMNNLVTVSILERKEWIAVHQDANGNIMVSGTKEMPLRFITSKTTGTTQTRNATAFTISGKVTTSSQVCEGWIIN